MPQKPQKNWAEYSGDDEVISSQELDIILRRQKEGTLNLQSKIPLLDRYCDGFRDGELYTVSGPTKHGKTLFLQSLTVSFCAQQEFPLWFSFEVPPRQFLSQFGPELPYFYLPKKLKAHMLPWVEDRIEEASVKYNSRAIIIDHLHFLFDLAQLRNPSIQIGTVIRRLKMLAVEKHYVIFLLCHTTKGKFKDGDDLSYDSIRDSSFVAQESDCVMMIRRDLKAGDNRAMVCVEFHRRTGVMEKTVKLVKKDGFFYEFTEQQDERKNRHGH
jgi:replicative DNA helicase